ncbi:hypothetical protein NGB36_14890 [Streptomyces sp. RB6PN25]|uniref:Uncharacterized protein n=1 Tax=Streptomyces humicola TaxID=2953240 RepID=A0ABT1PW20_9ACTN|nr:hypothetical protein [Streptomyces humicola]MCQ4081859.1 hypothetical protein [Streptomyces humicola]
MTTLRLTGPEEAADLAAFLTRLLRWDKAAVVRLQAAGAGPALAVFGHPPFGAVLAIRTWELTDAASLDATVSAGRLLDTVVENAATVTVPPEVTGPSWAGLLPPRGGWQRTAGIPLDALRAEAARVIAEFRARTEGLEPAQRTRAGLDALAEEIWSRRLGETALPLRAVHAAHALGFLRPVRAMAHASGPGAAPAAGETPALFTSGPWLRLRTAYGSVAVRTSGDAAGLRLTVTPLA